MSEYTVEAAQQILEKLQSKGWNLYAASFSIETQEVSPEATITPGPATEIMKNNFYVILPKSDEPNNPESVLNTLEKLVKKIEGKPLLPLGYNSIELLAFVLRKTDVEIPLEKKPSGSYKTVTVPMAGFIEVLDYFLDTRKTKQINYANIDQPIRKLIYTLDQLPFLRTIKSHSARIRQVISEQRLFLEGKNPDIFPEEDHCFIGSGFVELKLYDIFDSSAQNFMQEVRALSENYSFVTISHKGTMTRIDCDCDDLTRSSELKPDDDLEIEIRKKYEAKSNAAQKRINEFCEFRDKLMEIVEKYI